MVLVPLPSSETPVFTPPSEQLDRNQLPDPEAQLKNEPHGAEEVLPESPDHQATNARNESARQLNRYQVEMIAIGNFPVLSSLNVAGAAIGNGLLIQSGQALYLGGPVSLFLAYIFIGTVMYSVMVR
jgi:amino acid permease